jgi:hypothetical protein
MIFLDIDVDIARKLSQEELDIMIANDGIEVEDFDKEGTYLTDDFEIISPEILHIKDLNKLKLKYQKHENKVFNKLIKEIGLSRDSLRATLRNYKKFLTTKQLFDRLFFVLTDDEVEALIYVKKYHPTCMKLLRSISVVKVKKLLQTHVLNTDIKEYHHLFYYQQKKIDSLFFNIKIGSAVFFKKQDIDNIIQEIRRRFK